MEFQPLTCEQLMELRDDQRRSLSMFATVLRNHSGCTTPAETFLINLTRQHVTAEPLTPDDIDHEVQQFRDDFETAVRDARLFAHQYPTLVLGEEAGSYSEQLESLKTVAGTDDDGVAFVESARSAVRMFPDIVMAAELPEPWRSVSGPAEFTVRVNKVFQQIAANYGKDAPPRVEFSRDNADSEGK
jgi:hypothetical protein